MLHKCPRGTAQLLKKIRSFSTKSAPRDEPKYTHTINLPRTKFPPRLSAEKRAEMQERLRKKSFRELYEWQRENLNPEKEFVLHDGPPYANGDLHMGHAVNKILKDMVLRQKIAGGSRVHYVPGWDCHGLPIELKALDAYNRKSKGKSETLDPLAVRKMARKFALETIDKQREEFEQWGVTANWAVKDSWYRTLDVGYISTQLRLFQELYEKELIYRDLKPVFWSPSSRSALAEAELEYDEAHKSPSLYLKIRITSADACAVLREHLQSGTNVSAVIWTTTPWTLPANQAICFNSDLSYSLVRSSNSEELLLVGSELIPFLSEQLQLPLEKITEISGAELYSILYQHPIDAEELPFLPASHVKAEKGTGLVHTAPAHGPDDFLVFLNRKIPVKSLIDEAGGYNALAPAFLRGKFALTEGNQLVLERLRAQTLSLGTIEHSYPIDWRTKQPVMLRASAQWFINTDRLKEPALDAVERVDIYPHNSAEVSKKVLRGQLRKRPYWCISRQRAWGVPIPVVYERGSMKPVVHRGIVERVCRKLEETGSIDFWWTSKVEELVPREVLEELNLSGEDLVRGEDILDIWFDSGTSWLSVLGKDRVADLYLEGLDQFTGWFQSSLLTSVAARGQAPYRSIFVHGFAVDEKGMKMSKSLGNIISPRDIVQQYGCDALRWWVAAHANQNTSIPVSHKLLASSGESIQKIRAIMKYLLGVVASGEEGGEVKQDDLYHVDRYFLQELERFQESIFNLYETYQFNRASASILTFCVSTLSGFYMHLIKDRLYCGTDEQYQNLQAILGHTLNTLCKVLWPIAPFLIEESWSYKSAEPFFKSNPHLPNLKLDSCPSSPSAVIEQALDLKRRIYQQQEHQQLDVNTWLLQVEAALPKEALQKLRSLHPQLDEPRADTELAELLQIGAVTLTEGDPPRLGITKADWRLCPRCRRFAVAGDERVCRRCDGVLKSKSV